MQTTAAAKNAWARRFRLGIRGVDDDHFILFSLIAELQEAVFRNTGRAVVGALLENLVSYVRTHFSREERLLRSHHYRDLDQHIVQHDAFARKVLEYQADYQQGNLDLSHELLEYLKKWLIQHIMVADQEYAEYLRSHGVK